MSEKTDTAMKEATQENMPVPQNDVDLQELAEQIVKLLLREIELERMRTGNYY